VAGAVAAVTPVAALMFRFNNPDALMVLLLTAAAYATVRGVDDGRARWSILAGSLIGFAFLAKMLEAFLVVPAFGLVYLLAAPGRLPRRARQVLLGAVSLVVSAGWWVLAVQLTPAADRPYIGGSQDNSLWNLIFGYNGFGRLTGNETGSVVAGGGRGGAWGPTGITRLFGADMGTQASWLMPAALVLLVAGLLVVWRARRPDRTRAALVLWGGWLLVMGIAFSFGQGIIHPYYTVALAPAIGALVGVGGAMFWARRSSWVARGVLATCVALSGVWSFVLLGRTPSWEPWLRPTVLATGLVGVAGLLAWPLAKRNIRALVALAVAVSVLAGPAAYTVDTISTPHSGSIPSAGPATLTGSGAGPGGGGAAGATGRPGAVGRPGTAGALGAGGTGAGSGLGGPAAPSPSTGAPVGPSSGGATTRPGLPTGGPPGSTGGSGGAGGVGGLLNASQPSSELRALLAKDAKGYVWVAAAVGANQAAGYQLATGDPVMAIGGFNGTDPYPTLAEFEKLVREHKVHYFIGSGSQGGGGGAAGGAGSSTSSAIASWVESNFKATTVGGVSIYNLAD
jgi:4-amino-4-deoxy-L-arabinose transferase-like glycosyltransferase